MPSSMFVLHFKLSKIFKGLPVLFVYMLNAIWAIPVVLLIRIVRPLVLVRMGTFLASRSGHFIADASIFLANHHRRSAKNRIINLFWLPKQTCNDQWAKMVGRQLVVRWWVRYLHGFNRRIPGGASHELSLPSFGSRSNYNVFSKTNTRFRFTLGEEEAAKEWLRRRGWREGEPFVCLLVRDSAYLSSRTLTWDGGGERWSYHDYRDSDIDTYVEAIQALVDRGYWVVRMGKIMQRRLSLRHSHVIDYPFVDDQMDLMDIWLSLNCRFFVSTACGLDILACIYGRPIVYVNALPLISGVFWSNHIWVSKHLRWTNSGKALTLKEHCQHGYGSAVEYEKVGIAIVDLAPSEITAAVLECEQRTAGTWVDSADDKVRQRRYWDTLGACPSFDALNKGADIHPNARAGSSWLATVGPAFFD